MQGRDRTFLLNLLQKYDKGLGWKAVVCLGGVSITAFWENFKYLFLNGLHENSLSAALGIWRARGIAVGEEENRMRAGFMVAGMDWNSIGDWVFLHVKMVAQTIGVTGVGIGFVKFLRHAPAPRKDSVWAGCLFDTFQDLVSNESRIGERRGEDGSATGREASH